MARIAAPGIALGVTWGRFRGCYEKIKALTSRNPTGQCGAPSAAERTNASSTQWMPQETESERECVRRKESEDTAIRPSRYRVRHNVMPRCGAGSNCPSGSQAPLTIPTSTHSLWGQYAPPPFSSQVVLLVKHAPTALFRDDGATPLVSMARVAPWRRRDELEARGQVAPSHTGKVDRPSS
jgi:hypothetical protein